MFNVQKVYTNNMPKLTPGMARKAALAAGKEIEDLPASTSKDNLNPEIDYMLRKMSQKIQALEEKQAKTEKENEELKRTMLTGKNTPTATQVMAEKQTTPRSGSLNKNAFVKPQSTAKSADALAPEK